MIKEILFGWYGAFLYKTGLMRNEEIITSYQEKSKVCNDSCPLFTKALGMGWCDPNKKSINKYGLETNGCGCNTLAKKFTDSTCPLNRF